MRSVRATAPKPKTVKRVNNAEIEATLVLVKDRALPDSVARLPALRPFESGVVEFAKALPDNQRTFIEKYLRLDVEPAEGTEPHASAGMGAQTDTASAGSAVAGERNAVGATGPPPTLQSSDDDIRLTLAAGSNGPTAMDVDSAEAAQQVSTDTDTKAPDVAVKQERAPDQEQQPQQPQQQAAAGEAGRGDNRDGSERGGG